MDKMDNIKKEESLFKKYQNQIDIVNTIDEYKEYINYIKDKNVAVVGPADIIKGRNSGKEIEKNDIIMRFSLAFQFIPFEKHLKGIEKDTGSRTDVLYTGLRLIHNYLKNDKMKEEMINKIKSSGLKYIAVRPNSHETCSINNGKWVKKTEEIMKYFDKLPPEDLKKKNELMDFFKSKKLNVKIVFMGHTHGLLSTIMSEIKGRPIIARTGFLPIFDCFLFKAKTISIYAMTFYHKGGHLYRRVSVNEEGLHPLMNANQKEVWCHDSLIEIQIMKYLISIYPAFKLQSELENIIQVDEAYKKIFTKKYNQLAINKTKSNYKA